MSRLHPETRDTELLCFQLSCRFAFPESCHLDLVIGLALP